MRNQKKSRVVRVAVLAAVCVLGSCLATAQAPEGPQPAPPPQGNPPPPAAKPSTPQEPQQKKQEKPADAGVTISVEVPVVTLDVIATTVNGDIIPGLKRENFRVLEDGAPQAVTNFAPSEAPITIVVLMEFSKVSGGWFSYEAKYWADAFFPNLKPQDWVALVTYDMRTQLAVDFTQNKDEVRQAIYQLYYPGFSESNLFDALVETNNRLKDVKGKKSILVLSSGIDTFSKHTLDKTIKELRGTDVTIFAVGLDRPISNYLELHRALGNLSRMTFLQAENQLKTFTNMTGGYAWFPQFDGEIPGIFRTVAEFLRHQYSLTYTPTNHSTDGKYRKIKVELVAPDGSPLIVTDQKGKKQKIVVYAREGYNAPKGGVGD